MSTYQVLISFIHPTAGIMAIGDKFDDAGSLGQKLCRDGYAKDVTARVADTIEERVEDLEATATDHETRIAALELEQRSASASESSSESASESASASASESASASKSESASSSASASASESASPSKSESASAS